MNIENCHAINFEGDAIAVVATTPDGMGADAVAGVVVLVHGLGGQKHSDTHILAIKKFSNLGYATICFDFPGHGESGGSTETLTISKGARLVDHIAEMSMKWHQERPLAFFGASFGGTCILASSAIENAASIVLRAPVSDYPSTRARQLGAEGLSRWQRDGLIDGLISQGRLTPWAFYEEAKELDLYTRAPECLAPLLIVQGQDDDTVPMDDSLRLAKLWGGRSDVVMIAGGDHSLNDPKHTALFVALGCHWITDCVILDNSCNKGG